MIGAPDRWGRISMGVPAPASSELPSRWWNRTRTASSSMLDPAAEPIPAAVVEPRSAPLRRRRERGGSDPFEADPECRLRGPGRVSASAWAARPDLVIARPDRARRALRSARCCRTARHRPTPRRSVRYDPGRGRRVRRFRPRRQAKERRRQVLEQSRRPMRNDPLS